MTNNRPPNRPITLQGLTLEQLKAREEKGKRDELERANREKLSTQIFVIIDNIDKTRAFTALKLKEAIREILGIGLLPHEHVLEKLTKEPASLATLKYFESIVDERKEIMKKQEQARAEAKSQVSLPSGVMTGKESPTVGLNAGVRATLKDLLPPKPEASKSSPGSTVPPRFPSSPDWGNKK